MKKLFGVLLVLALVLSFSLVATTPAAADDPTPVPADRILEGTTQLPRVDFDKAEGAATLTTRFNLNQQGRIMDQDVLDAADAQFGGQLTMAYHEIKVYRPDDSVEHVKFVAPDFFKGTGTDWEYEGELWGVDHCMLYLTVAYDFTGDGDWGYIPDVFDTVFTFEWYTEDGGVLVATETMHYRLVDQNTVHLPTQPDTGMASFSSSAGTIEDLEAIEPPVDAPQGVELPHGMFEFKITGLNLGETVTLTIVLPSVEPDFVWWKYDEATDEWHDLPITVINANTIQLELTDGVYPGDLSGEANSTIIDPGGPGNPAPPPPPVTVGWEGSAVNKAAVMAPWIALFAALIASATLVAVRRRRAHT